MWRSYDSTHKLPRLRPDTGAHDTVANLRVLRYSLGGSSVLREWWWRLWPRSRGRNYRQVPSADPVGLIRFQIFLMPGMLWLGLPSLLPKLKRLGSEGVLKKNFLLWRSRCRIDLRVNLFRLRQRLAFGERLRRILVRIVRRSTFVHWEWTPRTRNRWI